MDDLYGSIVNADIIISICSMSSIEAAYFDKDVINLTIDIPEVYLSFYKNLNITYFADDYQKLKQLLKEIINDEKEDLTVAVNRKVNPNLGAAERIVEVIESKLTQLGGN